MESYEEIQEILTEDGRALTFSAGTMLALIGSSLSLLRQEPAFAEVEQLDFNFYVSTQDCVTLGIAEDDEFTIADDIHEYTFIVLRAPIPYTDGWNRIPAMFIGKVDV